MKKILVLCLSFLFISQAFANEYYDRGKAAYNLKQFGEARELFELAVKSKPKDITYKYYYAQTLMELGLVEEAAEQYQAITLVKPNSQEGILAAKVLQTMNKYFENQAGEFTLPDENKEDYLAYEIFEDIKLPRWNKELINVYIQDTDSAGIVEKAFQTWSEKAAGIMKFNFVPTKEVADITVDFIAKEQLVTPETGYINGSASLKYQGRDIVHATILIQDTDEKTKEKFNPDVIYATALHEIGHAIGLKGHSENPKDIMYNELTISNKTVSPRDVNTLMRIYKMDNETVAEIKTNAMAASLKLRETKDYAEAHPNLYNAWSNLAAAYVSAGDYENAVEALKKAIDLKGEDPALYTQLAGFYAKLSQTDLAIETYKHAYDLQPDNKVYLFNWAKACYKSKRANEAKEIVDAYLLGPGFLANDEISRSLRRMYKQDKEKKKEKTKKDRERREQKLQEMQEYEQDMIVE